MPLIIWGRKGKRSNIDTITVTGISFENKTNVLKQKNPFAKYLKTLISKICFCVLYIKNTRIFYVI